MVIVYTGYFWYYFTVNEAALSTIGIFIFLQAWNELMFAVIFISDSTYRTLSVEFKHYLVLIQLGGLLELH